MSRPFTITRSWGPRDEPWPFDPEDYVDAEPGRIAFDHFTALNEGTISVRVGDVTLPLDLRADLGLVFDELPDLLEQIALEDQASELYFAEQGTDVALVAARTGERVHLRLRRGLRPGSRFAAVPDELGDVSASEFVTAWRELAEAILDELVLLEPTLLHSPDAQAYRERLANFPQGPER